MIFRLFFTFICSFPGLASAAPVADTEPRAVTTTTAISWVTETVTVNPSDTTIFSIIGTLTEWPFTITSTIDSGCVTVSNIFPPNDPSPTSSDSTTSTVTSTVTSRTTVTETDTEHPPTTRYELTAAVVSMSTARTETRTKCTNTALRSFYVTTTYTSTQIRASSRTAVRNTEVCMTSTTRWLTPSATFVPTSPTPWQDPSYYTNGTIVTVSEGMARTTWVTISTDVWVATSVICNNPTTRTTSTYYTLTRTPFTTTISNQPTGCGSSLASAATPTATPAPSPMLPRWENSAVKDVQHAPSNVRKQADSPVETRTVLYSTTGMLTNGTIATLTWTGIVETYTQTFTTISMVAATVTATATKHVSGCSVPTTAASSG